MIRRNRHLVQTAWVPSDGKEPCWQPPAPHEADQWRSLNKAADTEAGRHCKTAVDNRKPWVAERERKREWAQNALAAAAAAIEQYHRFIRFDTEKALDVLQ